jgi:hypothetical protein
MIKEFTAMSEMQGVLVHVYDEDNELVFEVFPKWMLIGKDDATIRQDPESLKERAALHTSKKARQQWGYRWDQSVPSDVREFKQALTPAQQRDVTKFLKDHPDEEFSIHEVAALTDVEIEPLEKKPAWFPLVYSEKMSRSKKMRRNPAVGDSDTLEDIFKDYGLHRAIWKMNLGE